MKTDRKRLKGERVELLNQTKNLYKIIESKEIEIRDFLRHYERKTKDTSQAVKRLIDTKGEIEKENTDLKAQCVELLEKTSELNLLVESKNATINKLHKQMFEVLNNVFLLFFLSYRKGSIFDSRAFLSLKSTFI